MFEVDGTMAHLVSVHPELESLKLSFGADYAFPLHDSGLDALLKASGLKVIHLHNMILTGEDVSNNWDGQQSGVQDLSLAHCKFLTDQGLGNILARAGNL